MRTIKHIIQKEFVQIFRNRTMLPIIFLVPIIQMIVLAYAATFDIKNINVSFYDQDQSQATMKLRSSFEQSPFFKVNKPIHSPHQAENALLSDQTDIIVNIPKHFEKNIKKETSSSIQLLINAINGTKASLANVYASSLIQDFFLDYTHENNQIAIKKTGVPARDFTFKHWYNPDLNYKTFMVPGILVLLVTIIGMLLSGMNIVREKELGTIEQINVTPIKKYHFITGKLVPFWLIAIFELAFGLSIGKLLFDIPLVGSLWLVFLSAGVYLLVVLGIGLFISTISNTQQQAMFVSFFFMMTFILMSGLFTSVESMPLWAQWINKINPIAYFIKIIRMILLKGSDFFDIKTEIISLLVFGFVILILSTWRYKKTN